MILHSREQKSGTNEGRNMRKLITTLTATILMAGSIAWKAEAAAVTGVGSLPALSKTYSPIERVGYPYYRPYRYGGYGDNGYGYRPYGDNGYGYWPYGYEYGWQDPSFFGGTAPEQEDPEVTNETPLGAWTLEHPIGVPHPM
jgi:hypothetical protein